MPQNPLARAVATLERLPSPLAKRAITRLFTSQVRFAGTAGIRFETLQADTVVATLANRKPVRNHIGGVHAAAMALLAETASGAVFGMNVRGDALPLLKSMRLDYVRRAKGALRAVATLDDTQRSSMQTDERGALTVPVVLTDEDGESPVVCEMIWAWVPKKKD